MPESEPHPEMPAPPALTDQDIYEAMREIQGYLDITPGDFKEIFLLAYKHALERLRRAVRAGDLMTREVVAVSPEAPLPDVAKIMGDHGVSGVPVVDSENRVLGVISEKDFISRMATGGSKNFMSVLAECLQVKKCLALPMREQKAADLMSSPPLTVGLDTPLWEIARLFTENNINRAPVTDAAGRLLGMVSRGDLIRVSTQGP
jgi:CBS domain-containing membrane protein